MSRLRSAPMTVTVSAICIGLPRPFNGAELSAIDKRPIDGPVTVRSFGIEGDMVADTKNHGGADMAVHHYPRDHYAGWDAWLGGHDLLEAPAAFGENLVTEGLVENDVYIGDRFRLGGALLEVSQPRQPCWKIEHRFARKGMVKRIVKQHMSGWYYRVVEEGEAEAGMALQRETRGDPEWSVERAFAVLHDPSSKPSRAEVKALADVEALSEKLRAKLRARLSG